MRKIATAVLTAGLLVGSSTVAWAANPTIYHNGLEMKMNEPIVIQDNRTMLAVRDITQQMGMDINWDSTRRVATANYKEKEILFQPDLHRVIINGEIQKVDVGPTIINDRIYLPLRYLFELTDADVYFRQYEDGHQVVSVNDRDAYMNYIKKSGRVTTAVRNVEPGLRDSQVLIAHDGNIMEVHMDGNHVDIHRTTQTLSRVEERTEERIFHKAVTGIIESDGKYYAVLDGYQSGKMIGTGYFPVGSAILEKIATPQGDFRFHESAATLATCALEGSDSFGEMKVTGHLLNIGAESNIRDKAYAFSNKDTYGFLTDGQFLLIGNNPSDGYHVVTCKTINDTIRQGKLFYNSADTFYYAIGVDKAGSSEELFVTAYTSEGLKTLSYIPISNYGESDNHRYLEIKDVLQLANKVYFLLKTDTDLYLANYDLSTHRFDSEKLLLPYEKFVMANGGWQLYYGDSENYHFYTLN